MFPVPTDQWTGWWCEPMCLVNGRMLEREPLLLNGKWFGGNDTTKVSSNMAHIPCYVEITMPKKRFISHVVVAESPDLARLETMTVDVYVETPDKRHNLTDYEARQEKKGYWVNTIKRKGNTSCYNVYKLPKTYYTNRVRVYLLNGYSSVDEIELYETVPQFTKTSKAKDERADAEQHP
jgi:hypothetical protein